MYFIQQYPENCVLTNMMLRDGDRLLPGQLGEGVGARCVYFYKCPLANEPAAWKWGRVASEVGERAGI